ncbi:hypothetical protein H4I95_10907 [Botrytis cinerea]
MYNHGHMRKILHLCLSSPSHPSHPPNPTQYASHPISYTNTHTHTHHPHHHHQS